MKSKDKLMNVANLKANIDSDKWTIDFKDKISHQKALKKKSA